MNVMTAEVSPIHKVDFSIACELKFANAGEITALGDMLKAGRFMYSNTAGMKIKNSPTTGCTSTKGTQLVSGILMHDVMLDPAILEYPVGILVSGVVYEDVVEMANGTDVLDAEKAELAKQGTLFYNVITMK